MKNYEIFQANISRQAYDYVNSEGWDKAIAKYPALKSKFIEQSSEVTKELMNEYDIVATVKASDLEDVFTAGNIEQERLVRLNQMHSVSVGDIIHDVESNGWYLVAPFGFEEIIVSTL